MEVLAAVESAEGDVDAAGVAWSMDGVEEAEALSLGAGVAVEVDDEEWRVATIAASAAIPTTIQRTTRFEPFLA